MRPGQPHLCGLSLVFYPVLLVGIAREFVSQGLGETHSPIGELLPMLPQLVYNTVCPCRYFYDFGGLFSGHV